MIPEIPEPLRTIARNVFFPWGMLDTARVRPGDTPTIAEQRRRVYDNLNRATVSACMAAIATKAIAVAEAVGDTPSQIGVGVVALTCTALASRDYWTAVLGATHIERDGA